MRCPGQDTGFWDFSSIFEVKCPKCGGTVEFFKDDPVRACKHCGHEFVNPKLDFGCAAYCKYAEQCLGELSPDVLASREDLFKDRVAIEVKKFYQKDFKRINRAMRAARHAEKIISEEQGNPAVILAAAYLREVGKEESGANDPSVAAGILEKLGARKELVDEVCELIGYQHQPSQNESLNYRILHDAETIVSLEDHNKHAFLDSAQLATSIDNCLLTITGRTLARKVLAVQHN